MKNLFNTLFGKELSQQTDVMDIVTNKYPKVVQDIHREFLTAGDRLLASAKYIIDSISIPNEEKVGKLNRLGFHQAQEVIETGLAQARRMEQQKIAVAITDFKILYPNNKLITDDIVKKICDKYRLVLGQVDQYKGFVPEKNIKDIELFFENHPEDGFTYLAYYNSTSRPQTVSKEEYTKAIEEKKYRYDNNMVNIHREYSYAKSRVTLNICAPLSDMDTRGYKVKGHILVREMPDPIVLLPLVHKNGVKLNIILTAWGDESVDPMVMNEKLN